ncbi:uncharacterized protein [Spinacia oleracea]|uniref:PGG domain-containing protein n=1 Tax=Spinacia oleracea TaxID=3562 RepID=A0A9R0IRR3_SPIOL|nr:uncharacterized protein LOC110793680 [Spinacia oleracea]
MASIIEIMDVELGSAALNGDVDFLAECVESNKPIEYYMTYFPKNSDKGDRRHGNIFHMAAYNNNADFIREAIEILPSENTQQLLIQPREPINGNPLHVAAQLGNVEIVNIFLDVYKCLPSLPSDLTKRPWLVENTEGDNPCNTAVNQCHEECALEIVKMDIELLCNKLGSSDANILYDAVNRKLVRFAAEILRSPHPIGCTGFQETTPFHSLHYSNKSDEAEEICRQLLRRKPDLIKQQDDNGNSAFHLWASDGKMWPFECILESSDIIPDIKTVFTDLVSTTNIYGENPLHNLVQYTASENDAIKIAELLIDTYKNKEASNVEEEEEEDGDEDEDEDEDELPWFVHDNGGDTPLSLAISPKYENFAMYILSVDDNAVIKCQKNLLFLAIENKCHQLTEKIYEIVINKGWTQLLTNDQHNILHIAPLCTKEFCTRLIEENPGLLKGVDKAGLTVLHTWISNPELWLFEFILKSKWRIPFIKLIDVADYGDRNNPFHIVASLETTPDNDTIKVIKLLVEAYKEENINWSVNSMQLLPWSATNKKDEGSLQLAISNKHEQLSLYLLSLHEDDDIDNLLGYYEPEHSLLFLAIQNKCPQVAKKIMSRLDKETWTKYLKDPSDGRNILHLAPTLEDTKFGTWLVDEAPEFITDKDNNEQSPWDKAYEIGPAWFINAVLKKKPSVFSSAPLVWTKACEKGHVLALSAFVDHNPGKFRDLCIKHKDSPLHHIKLDESLTEYEKFLQIPHMKDLINLQDSKGITPLHKAIRSGDLLLTETLLNMEKIIYDIEDDDNISAMDLLAAKCDESSEDKNTWDRMCKRFGLDPKINTTYFKSKTNLLEVRSSLFIVAALLATITFTAGFTIPGGFNQESGAALLGKKPAFLVFLISNALALFFSMLVLICLTWSMVFDASKSLVLIDRSMVLLRLALNCTLLAFMTGVYIVIAPMSLWAAILIIIIISGLIGISVDKNILYNVLDKLIPSPKKKGIDLIRKQKSGISNNEQDQLLNNRGQNENLDAIV